MLSGLEFSTEIQPLVFLKISMIMSCNRQQAARLGSNRTCCGSDMVTAELGGQEAAIDGLDIQMGAKARLAHVTGSQLSRRAE